MFELFVAWRYLRPIRREGFVSVISAFSIIGIALGVATLIMVTSLMNGVRSEMMRLFIGIDGAITVAGPAHSAGHYAQLAQQFDAHEDVAYSFAKMEGQVMVTHKGAATGAQVLAISAEAIAQKPLLSQHINMREGGGLWLGTRLANKLGVQVGQQITLISPQGRSTFAGFIPRMKTYPVAGTFKLGMHAYDASLIVMPLQDALSYFKPAAASEEQLSMLELGVKKLNDAPKIAAQLQQQLGADYLVLDWQRRNETVFSALAIQRNVMAVILTLIVLVAAFNIISSLIMLVQDKRADIAVLRTMGASRGHIIRLFSISGSLTGVVGTLAGLVLGLIAAQNLEAIRRAIEAVSGQELLVENIYFLSSLPTQTDAVEVAIIIVVSLALSFVATLYPAYRAASIQPAEVLRYG